MASNDPADSGSSVLRDIDRWWFGTGSAVSLGLFRIAMSLVTFASLLMTGLNFEAFYTEKGFIPIAAMSDWWTFPASFSLGPDKQVHLPFIQNMPRINFLGGTTSEWVTAAFYIAVMIAALLTALGLWTRISSIALAVGVICIHHRSPLILHSGDTLERLCLIYLAWAPSGAACSLDRVIGLWKGRIAPGTPPIISLWGQRLIQYQVALVYFTTVWWKWFGTDWKNGTATWFPENLKEFNRFPVPEFLRHQPFIAMATYSTLVVELSLATLIFYKPLRKYVLLAGIAMHGYIEYRFNIPFFAITIIATYIVFYDGEEISAWAKKIGGRLARFRLLVQIPRGRLLRPGPQAALSAMDPLGLVTYDPGSSPGWTALTIQARPARPFFGSYIRSIGAWPLGLVPGLWRRTLNKATASVDTAPSNGRNRPGKAPKKKARR